MPTTETWTPGLADFPTTPTSWFFVCESRFLEQRPRSFDAAGKSMVLFRDETGRPRALDAHCPHLGARLDRGHVTGGRLRCPFHGWSFDADGHCTSSDRRVSTYATAERFGGVFVFPAEQPLFELPGFDEPNLHLVSSRPFHYEIETPWFMVGAQAFDIQHFDEVHGRILEKPPLIEKPGRYARRLTCNFRITGPEWMDRATRWLSGDRVEFQITNCAGNFVLVRTRFAHDRTYGIVVTTPIDERRVRITIIANASVSEGRIGKIFLDPLRLRLKRIAVQSMTRHDVGLLDGLRYRLPELDERDDELGAYLRWVAELPRGAKDEVPRLHRRSA